MKHLRKFNENSKLNRFKGYKSALRRSKKKSVLQEELQDFCETQLAYLIDDGVIELNAGKEIFTIEVENKGDRPVQVGSHYHFFEVNSALSFDRVAAYGRRLDVAAGTSVRFEPGSKKSINLIDFSGRRYVSGFNGLVEGFLDDENIKAKAMQNLNKFLGV